MKKNILLLLLICFYKVQTTPEIRNKTNETAVETVLTVSDEEKQILIDLYNATDGVNWINNTNWLSEEPVAT